MTIQKCSNRKKLQKTRSYYYNFLLYHLSNITMMTNHAFWKSLTGRMSLWLRIEGCTFCLAQKAVWIRDEGIEHTEIKLFWYHFTIRKCIEHFWDITCTLHLFKRRSLTMYFDLQGSFRNKSNKWKWIWNIDTSKLKLLN